MHVWSVRCVSALLPVARTKAVHWYFFLLFFGDVVTLGLIALWKCQRFKDGPRDKSNIVLSLLFTQFSVNIHNFHCRNSNVFHQQGVLPQTRWTCYVISVTRISFVFFFLAQQSLVGQGLIIRASRSHSDISHSVRILCKSDQPYVVIYTWQHTTVTTYKHPCQPAIPADSRLRLRGHWHRLYRITFLKPQHLWIPKHF